LAAREQGDFQDSCPLRLILRRHSQVPWAEGLANGVFRLSQSLGQTLGQIRPILAATMTATKRVTVAVTRVGLVCLILIMDSTSLPGPLRTPG
jgi:hypothetical protein